MQRLGVCEEGISEVVLEEGVCTCWVRNDGRKSKKAPQQGHK